MPASQIVHLCNVYGEYEQHDALDMREVDGQGFAVWCAKFSPGVALCTGSCSVLSHSGLVGQLMFIAGFPVWVRRQRIACWMR
jgi:hypothetical protein